MKHHLLAAFSATTMLIAAIHSTSAARPVHQRSDAPLYVVQLEQPGVGRFCSYRIGREDHDEPHIYIMREKTPDTMWIGIELPVGQTWQTDDPLTVSVDGQNWTLPPSDNGHGQRARNIALSVSPYSAGRDFMHALWSGNSISVNGREALPLDHPAVAMAALTKCTDTITGKPSLTPEVPLSAAATTSGGPITLIASRGGFMIDGVLNGSTPVRFILDTGASDVTLPASIVDHLMHEGSLTPVGNTNFTLANGSKVMGSVYRLRSLTVGGYTAYDVVCSETPDGSDPLLGQSFLGKFRSINIDTVNHTLSLG